MKEALKCEANEDKKAPEARKQDIKYPITFLTDIRLGMNKLSDDGAIAVANVLKNGGRIESIDVCNLYIVK